MKQGSERLNMYAYATLGVLTLAVCAVWFRAESIDIMRMVPVSQTDVVEVQDLARLQLYYGVLEALPHTYTFTVRESTRFSAQLFIPAADEHSRTVSAILVKEPAGKGRVTEIARLHARDATWQKTSLDVLSGTMLSGPAFSGELAPGTYRFEVHTPDNTESYLVAFGSESGRTLSYGAYVRELTAVTRFLGHSPVRVLASPHVFAPLYGFILIVSVWYIERRKRRRTY